jgi:superfamily I DNA/RNA helicase
VTVSSAPQDADRVWIGRGPRAVEALLLERVLALHAEARSDWGKLSLPLRVVVPSRSLADHVGERLVARAGRSLASVLVQTLHGLALELLERAGEAAPRSDAFFPILVRRIAAQEAPLRDPLAALADGYASVEAAVADLLDAGFEPAIADAVHDGLDAARGDPAALARAHAVARVAERCLTEMERTGVGHRALLFRGAREALLRDPERVLPARGLIVHGFSDATGLRAELIEALVQVRHAIVLMDEPPDPAEPAQVDPGVRFSLRLRQRLPPGRPAAPAPPAESRVELLEAGRPEAELREVAARVRAALDRGIEPERIGIVARDLSAHRAALRVHLRGLGIPFSGPGSGGAGALARRAAALDALLREGPGCRTDRWLAASAPPSGAGGASALRLNLRRQGLLRLRDVAARESIDGFPAAPGAARASASQLGRVAAGATCGAQLDALEDLLREGLGWRPGRAEVAPLREELARLRREVGEQPSLAPEELALLVRRSLVRRVSEPFGGEGGGVQVLDVMQARGRSFELLFLVGLVRDAFPRSVREEALLADFVRERLRAVLPDVPVKLEGHDEERYLFAQLVAASPHVTLSWPRASEDGRECARSSFVERLLRGASPGDPLTAGAGPFTLRERGLRAALSGSRRGLREVLPLALRELVPRVQSCPPEDLARIRSSLVAEFESRIHPRPRLGAYFGFVGALRQADDPRRRPLSVTTLENLARCSWRTFLRRVLRVDPPLDADDKLPGVDTRMLGTVVHGVLEDLFRDAAGRSAAELWPEDTELIALAVARAHVLLEEEFVPLPELAQVLARQALPYLQRARTLDAADGAKLRVLGSESERSTRVADASGVLRELRFRVDRVERFEGAERLTDYKTGKPLSGAVGDDTRARSFAARIAKGEALQPVAYALAAGAGGSGRLLFLDPELAGREEAASYVARREDESVVEPFERATRALFAAWDAGSFLPRLLDPKLEKDGDACRWCEVGPACLQNDTTSRRRLRGWVEQHAGSGEADLAPAERAALAVFRLSEPARRERGIS